MRKGNSGGGFALIEFAIALPLLILLMYGLATVGREIFYLGRVQLADYVLEEEVHEVLSRLIYDARAAKSVEAYNGAPTLTFTYRTINEVPTTNGYKPTDAVINVKDTGDENNRVYILKGTLDEEGSKINYKRITEYLGNPITGDNYFGGTRVNQFEFRKLADKVLRVTLEMQSEVSGHKIKISTAVYLPGCESFEVH